MTLSTLRQRRLGGRASQTATLFGLCAGVALLVGCGSPGSPVADEGPSPAKQNQQLPVFVRPFEGRYRNTNPFDHNYPLGQAGGDGNSDFITFRGENIQPGWDGHNGHDWVMSIGTPLLSVADGEVTFAGSEPCDRDNANGDALIVRIRHTVTGGEVFDSIYGHVAEFAVSVGDTVKAGQVIAWSGNTGCSSGPHLHFSVVRVTSTNNGEPSVVDPFGWEGGYDDPWAYHPDGAQSLWLWKPGQAPDPYDDQAP